MDNGRTKFQMKSALAKIMNFGTGMRQIPGLSLALSPRMAAGVAIVLICALAWTFYMGFRVGRGEHPAEGLPAVGNLLEKDKVAEVEPAPAETPAPEPVAATEAAGQPARPMPATPAPFTKPDGAGLTAWASDTPQPAVTPASAVEKKTSPQRQKAAPEATKKTAKFIYTYQVAAVKNSGDAANLQKKLQNAGLKCALRKSGKVTLGIVTIRGTEAEARALQAKLRGLKLGKPLLLSRKELAPATQTRKKK